jgi:DNA-binding NarL/FixJ family response regulator
MLPKCEPRIVAMDARNPAVAPDRFRHADLSLPVNTTKLATLVLADDYALVREGIAAFCGSRPDLKILAQSADGEEAVELILALKPDFAVLDLNLPKLSGLEVILRVRQAKSETKLVVLSVSRDASVIRELFRSGANGYVLKNGPSRHLFDAINFIQDGGQYLTPLIRRESIDTKTQKKDSFALLSKRECEVFSFLVDGIRPKDIAKMLEISPKTVDTYRANIMRKLEIYSIAGLVRFAIKRNLQTSSSSSETVHSHARISR